MTAAEPSKEHFSSVRRAGLLAGAAGLLTGGCSATGVLNALTPRGSYRGTEGIAYGPGPRQQLDVYQPATPHAGPGAPPLVVFFYGGNWNAGDRGNYRFVGEALASEGAVVVIPDYRLYPEVRYPEILQDGAQAVRWAFEQASELGGDSARIHVMGHSAGAYNAAMLALDPRWLGPLQPRLAGFIGLAGPYNFLPIEDPVARRVFGWPDTPPESQPITHVSRGDPRSLLIAASSDDRVNPQRNTLALAARLEAAGVPVTLRVLDGVNHVTVIGALAQPLRGLAPVLPTVLDFLGIAAPKA